jgi:hypothetical protein
MLAEHVASLSTEEHCPLRYTNNSKKMCRAPAPGEKSFCNKNRFPRLPLTFSWPKKDAEKKVEETNKLPVLKF